MSTQPSSVTSSLNQLNLGKLPMLRLSSTIKTSILTKLSNYVNRFTFNAPHSQCCRESRAKRS